ncbi:MAG: SRPBCC family protein, partial [Myxococcales bacterium]|nr:SRPBCC family protein [Myxococcales bacterium]
WRGNGDVGAGRMEIVESRPSEKLRVRLEFLEPFEATNMATFTLAPRGDGTEVVWAMDGDNSFIGKVVSVFMDMDALIGQDFERGLESLREVSVTSGT